MDAVGSGSGIQPNRELKPKETKPPSRPPSSKAAHKALGKQAEEAQLPRESLPAQHRTTAKSHLPEGEKAAQVSKSFFAPLLKAGKKVSSGLDLFISKLAQKGGHRATMVNRSDESRLKAAVKEKRPDLEQKKEELQQQLNKLSDILKDMSIKGRRLNAGNIRREIGGLAIELSSVNEKLEKFDALDRLKQARAAQATVELKLSELEHQIQNHPEKLQTARDEFEMIKAELEAAKEVTKKAQDKFDQVCPTPTQQKQIQAAESDKISKEIEDKIKESLKLSAQIKEIAALSRNVNVPIDRYLTVPTEDLKSNLQHHLEAEEWGVIVKYFKVEGQLEQLYEKQRKLA